MWTPRIAMLVLAAGGACAADPGLDLPLCDDRSTKGIFADGRGALQSGVERAMVVVASPVADELWVGENIGCDPVDEGMLSIHSNDWGDGAWLPPVGAEVRALFHDGWLGGYAQLRSPDGLLLLEGGTVSSESEEPPQRFRVIDDPGAPECIGDPGDCIAVTFLRAALQTDDGEIEMESGERRAVTVEGETFAAVVGRALRQRDGGCGITDFEGGPRADVTLARTTPADLTMVEPVEPADDECPPGQPAEGDPCTTRGELQCNYSNEVGCSFSYECSHCFWRLKGRGFPEGVDCGDDPFTCQGKGCPEESVCTECPCAGWTSERWRCVWPEDECPPCT